MTFGELKTEVEVLVKDGSFADKYGDYINEALFEAVDRVNLPDLKRIDVVTTTVGQNYTSLVESALDFSGKLRRVVKSADNQAIHIYQNLEALFDYGDSEFSAAGEVEAVALEGRLLWYTKVPETAETLRVVYFQNPPLLSDDNEECELIPKELQRGLLVYGAAKNIFGIIEEGLEETQKVNSLWTEGQFEKAMVRFHEHLGRRKQHYISSCWRV